MVWLPEALKGIEMMADYCGFSFSEIPITFDAGFYSHDNHDAIWSHGMIPVIKPNHRNTKNLALIAAREDCFAQYHDLYRQRIAVERTFAWEDTYRKLVIRYERLECTFLGLRYLAWSMINLRHVVSENLG